jgi:hypothetical protein
MKINNETLNEIVHKTVKKYLKEAMSEQFSFDKLKSIPSFSGRLKYCNDTLGFRIGSGSSRTCFQLDDNRILKLALNAKGIAQNEVEARIDYNLDSLGIRPEIFDETDYENNWFIVCEYVLPAKANDFKQTLGISWREFCNFVKTCNCEKKGGNPPIDWDTMQEMIDDNDKLWSIHDYIANYDAPIGDLIRICNYGLSKSNGIVILDMGLDDYVLNNFYKH